MTVDSNPAKEPVLAERVENQPTVEVSGKGPAATPTRSASTEAFVVDISDVASIEKSVRQAEQRLLDARNALLAAEQKVLF